VVQRLEDRQQGKTCSGCVPLVVVYLKERHNCENERSRLYACFGS